MMVIQHFIVLPKEATWNYFGISLNYGVDRRSINNGCTLIHVAASNGHFRSCLFLMGNLQDIDSFFKGIWNGNSIKSIVAKCLRK